MLKTTTTMAIVSMAGFAFPALADIPPEWITEWERGAIGSPRGLAVDEAGNSYMAFDIGLHGGDILVQKFDADGAFVWETSYNGPAGGQDIGNQIELSPGGDAVYVSGRVTMPGFANSDYALLKLDSADGSLLWVAFHDGPATGIDDPRALDVGPSGQIVVAGKVWNGDERYDYGTVLFDSDGNKLWSAIYGGPGPFLFNEDSVVKALITGDGDVVVTGDSTASGNDIVTIRYDGATGEEEWFQRYGGDGGTQVPYYMELTPAGDVAILGRQTGSDGAYVTILYNGLTGERQWITVRDFTFDDVPTGLAVDAEGDVYIAGFNDPDSDDSNSNNDMVLFAFQGDSGAEKWFTRFGDSDFFESEIARELSFDDAGNFYILGGTTAVEIAGDTRNGVAFLMLMDEADGSILDMGVVDTTPGPFTSDLLFDMEFDGSGRPIAHGYNSDSELLLIAFPSAIDGCPADLDGDGDADGDDFFAYLDLFSADDERADIDGNGVIDADDFFAYLDLFAAGC